MNNAGNENDIFSPFQGKKVIKASSNHISWSFLCEMLSYVPMFTIQKRGGFSLLDPLLSID